MPLNSSGIFYADTSTEMSVADITSAMATSISNIINDVITTAVPVATVTQTAAASAPDGWLICDGAAVSRTTYAALFTALGGLSSPYGLGDGSTTFNLPNLKGRVPVGKSTGGTFANLGAVGGEESHKLTIAEMPYHNHTQDAHSHNVLLSSAVGSSSGYSRSGATHSTELAGATNSAQPGINYTGGDGYHNNLQPYIVMNYAIKY